MEKKQILSMLSILKKAYPSYYKDITKDEATEIVDFYEEMFKDDDSELVLYALKEIINTSEFPPSIATIKNKIYDLTHESVNNLDLWNKLVKAIGRSSYYAEEEYNKLPDLLKEYVRSPHRLQEMASMDSEIINSVEKGIFMKQIENIKEQIRNGEIVGRKDNLLMNKGVYMLEDFEDEDGGIK